MKISTYEIVLPLIGKEDRKIEGKALLVNGLYGAIDVVDEAVATNLQEGRIGSIPFALRERLAQRGHITRKDAEGELADARLLGRAWNKLIGRIGTGPVILPTYDCNFRCPYCFERHRLSRGQEWLGHEMKPEMVEAVFAALQKQQDKGYKVESCALYGGEPLLKENMATVRNICERARDMGLPLSAITNGYDLEVHACGILHACIDCSAVAAVRLVDRLDNRRILGSIIVSYLRSVIGRTVVNDDYLDVLAAGKK